MAPESDRAVATLESLIPLVEPDDRELALFLEADLAAHAQMASLAARDVARKRLARYDVLDGATPGERIVLASKAFELARASDVERDAVDAIADVLTGGGLLDEQIVDVPATIYVLLVGLLATDALDLVDDSLGRMLQGAQRRASTPATAFVLAHQAVAAMRRGAVAHAEAEARTALDLLTAQDIPLGTALALAVLIDTSNPGQSARPSRRWTTASSASTYRRGCRPSAARGVGCCVSPRADRARDSTTCSSSVGVTRRGEGRTRTP